MIFFPFAPIVLNLLHKLHVIESFSSLFSSGHGYCLRHDGANWEQWQSDSVLLHLASLSICLTSLLIQLILIAVSVWKIYKKLGSAFARNRCLYAEKKNIMLVLWLVVPTPREIPLAVQYQLQIHSSSSQTHLITNFTLAESLNCVCVPK